LSPLNTNTSTTIEYKKFLKYKAQIMPIILNDFTKKKSDKKYSIGTILLIIYNFFILR